MTDAPLTFGSMFAGIGGFDLGFERAGMVCQWQVEIDDYCQRVLAKHWPNVRRWSDVRTFPPEPVDDWRVDVVCGGDPCQANSAAVGGNRSQHESLGGEFVRVVAALRPRVVVRENPSRVIADAPWPWWRMRRALERLGYACLPFRLRACCLGAIHRRERLFVLAAHADTDRDGLEGRASTTATWQAAQPARLVDVPLWPAIPAIGGFASRAGIPDYVARMRAIGNALPHQVAEWIGRRIVEGLTT